MTTKNVEESIEKVALFSQINRNTFLNRTYFKGLIITNCSIKY